MKIRSDYDDDQIQFAGYGSATTITEYAEPRKRKRKHPVGFAPPAKTKGARKFKVGFAIPKKTKDR